MFIHARTLSLLSWGEGGSGREVVVVVVPRGAPHRHTTDALHQMAHTAAMIL